MRDWASIVDGELAGMRARQAQRLHAEHVRMARVRQAREDARIVAEREQRVAVSRAHARVKELLT